MEVACSHTEADTAQQDCAICQSGLGSCGGTLTLQCGHPYCAHCIQQWMRRSRRCPVCRETDDRDLGRAMRRSQLTDQLVANGGNILGLLAKVLEGIQDTRTQEADSTPQSESGLRRSSTVDVDRTVLAQLVSMLQGTPGAATLAPCRAQQGQQRHFYHPSSPDSRPSTRHKRSHSSLASSSVPPSPIGALTQSSQMPTSPADSAGASSCSPLTGPRTPLSAEAPEPFAMVYTSSGESIPDASVATLTELPTSHPLSPTTKLRVRTRPRHTLQPVPAKTNRMKGEDFPHSSCALQATGARTQTLAAEQLEHIQDRRRGGRRRTRSSAARASRDRERVLASTVEDVERLIHEVLLRWQSVPMASLPEDVADQLQERVEELFVEASMLEAVRLNTVPHPFAVVEDILTRLTLLDAELDEHLGPPPQEAMAREDACPAARRTRQAAELQEPARASTSAPAKSPLSNRSSLHRQSGSSPSSQRVQPATTEAATPQQSRGTAAELSGHRGLHSRTRSKAHSRSDSLAASERPGAGSHSRNASAVSSEGGWAPTPLTRRPSASASDGETAAGGRAARHQRVASCSDFATSSPTLEAAPHPAAIREADQVLDSVGDLLARHQATLGPRARQMAELALVLARLSVLEPESPLTGRVG